MSARDEPQSFDERKCPHCGGTMTFTGLPDVAGAVNVRFYRCAKCGVVKVPIEERGDGWG